MMTFFRKILGSPKEDSSKNFSTFFGTATQKERTDLLRQVVREANKDQKKLMDEVGELSSKDKAVRV
jgi:hypothetical protein